MGAYFYLPSDPPDIRQETHSLINALVRGCGQPARYYAATLLRYYRGKGNKAQCKALRYYLAWMGYPFSERYWINQANAHPTARWAKEILSRYEPIHTSS